jgi:hypothetical protein
MLYRRLFALCDGEVRHGAFRGMKLSASVAWGRGALGPKLLGCYEQEIHPALAEFTGLEAIVDIGSAEGYYAAGLARLHPQATIYAFDISEQAREITAETAGLNGVTERVRIGGLCGHAELERICRAGRTMILSDCEGAELELIDLSAAPTLAQAALVIELHDFLKPQITPALTDRLRHSHDIAIVQQGTRNPYAYPELDGMNELDRYITLCEMRPAPGRWMIANPR